MIQKTKWMNYLGFGVCSLFLLFTLSSCQKDEFGEVEWIYINETEHEILVHSILESFTIEPFGQYTDVERTPIINSGDSPDDFSLFFSKIEIIKYDKIKCDTIKEVREGLWNISNYQAEKLNYNYYQYTYRFTEADYERAEDCE